MVATHMHWQVIPEKTHTSNYTLSSPHTLLKAVSPEGGPALRDPVHSGLGMGSQLLFYLPGTSQSHFTQLFPEAIPMSGGGYLQRGQCPLNP